jgi:hypothetical protein
MHDNTGIHFIFNIFSILRLPLCLEIGAGTGTKNLLGIGVKPLNKT